MGTLSQRLARLSPEQRDYTLRSLPAHLAAAGRGQELLQALTAFDFAQAKLSALGPAPLAADYDLAQAAALELDGTDKEGLRLIGDALRLSAPALTDQPRHLASQLLARLSPDDQPAVARLLEQAEAGPGGPWLRPLRPSLSRAGGPLRFVLSGHRARVRSIAVTPDGSRAVSAGDDHSLILWDLATGAMLYALPGHTDQVYSVAISRDGRLALSGSNDQTVRLWDLQRGSVKSVLRGHEAPVKAVALTPDGAQAISVAADQTIVWDLDTGQPLARRAGHGGYNSDLALLPGGRLAISPADDHSLRLWDLRTGQERSRLILEGHTGNINTVALAPDGRRAISGAQDGTLVLWDLDRGAPMSDWQIDERGLNQVTFLPDGQLCIAAGESSTLTIWDLESGASVWQTKDGDEGLKAVAVSADGALALSAAYDPTVKVWNLPVLLASDGQRQAQAPVSAVTCAGPYAFTQMAPQLERQLGPALTVWDIASAQERFTLTDCRFLAAAPPAERALLSSSTGELALWDLTGQSTVCPIPGDRPVAFMPDGSQLITSLEGGSLSRFRSSDGAPTGELNGHQGPITGLALSDDGRLALSAGSDGSVRLWDLASGREIGRRQVGRRQVTAVVLTPDARTAVVGLDNGKLLSWAIEGSLFDLWLGRLRATPRQILKTGSDLRRAISIPSPADRSVTALALSARGQQAITASGDGAIRTWRLPGGSLLRTLEHEDWEDVAIMPDGSLAVVHSLSQRFGYGRRQIWDLNTGTVMGELPAGTLLPQLFLQSGPDGGPELVQAITAVVKPQAAALKRSWEPERMLGIWDLERMEAALSFVGDFDWTQVAVAADGRTIVAGDSIGQVHFLRLENS